MLIRSQDKTALVKFENIVVNLKLPDSLNVICWSLQDAQRSGGYFILGEYSTKAKAMKVLDMIQEAYGDSEYTKYVIPEVCRILSMKPKTEENKAHAGELGEMLKKRNDVPDARRLERGSMKYRKKPVIIDALQWTGKNKREMFDFLEDYQCTDQYMSEEGKNIYIDHWKVPGGLVIKTLEGEHLANIGDYIIKGVHG